MPQPLRDFYCLVCRELVDRADMVDNGVGLVCKPCHKKEAK